MKWTQGYFLNAKQSLGNLKTCWAR